jgi:hypothetical protein
MFGRIIRIVFIGFLFLFIISFFNCNKENSTEPGDPLIKISTKSIVFGSIVSNRNMDTLIVIQNKGTGSLNISAKIEENSNEGNFTLLNDTSSFSISAGDSNILNLRFSPKSKGIKTAKLIMRTNSSDTILTIDLNGTVMLDKGPYIYNCNIYLHSQHMEIYKDSSRIMADYNFLFDDYAISFYSNSQFYVFDYRNSSLWGYDSKIYGEFSPDMKTLKKLTADIYRRDDYMQNLKLLVANFEMNNIPLFSQSDNSVQYKISGETAKSYLQLNQYRYTFFYIPIMNTITWTYVSTTWDRDSYILIEFK